MKFRRRETKCQSCGNIVTHRRNFDYLLVGLVAMIFGLAGAFLGHALVLVYGAIIMLMAGVR